MRTWELPAPIWRPPFLNHTFPRLPAGLWGRATPLALALSAPERGASAGLVPTSLLLRGGRGAGRADSSFLAPLPSPGEN